MVKNRPAILGISFTILGAGIKYLGYKMGLDESTIKPLGDSILVMGICGASATAFGFETYLEYKRTKQHIEKRGTIDSRFVEKVNRMSYCGYVGARMAAQESDLEHLFTPSAKLPSNNPQSQSLSV